MNRERLEVLAAHGFRQLSFGVETLDPEINAQHNRGRQGIEMIERCFDDLRAVGIPDVACDVLLGLAGTTPEGMLVEMETLLRRFRPEWIDIFMLTPTHSYIERHFGGSWDDFWTHIARFQAIVPPALSGLAARTGYEVRMGQGHHMLLHRPLRTGWGWKLLRAMPQSLWLLALPLARRLGVRVEHPPTTCFYTPLTTEARRPVNVLGLGRSARSVIFGTAAFAVHDPQDNPALEGPAGYVGSKLDVTDEARTFLAHLLRDNDTVDRDEFRQIFGGDMPDVIPAALAGWEKEGTARLEGDVLRFVSQDRRARIRSLLWLVPEEAIEFDLAHFKQLELSSSGIARLVAPIKPGTTLAGGLTFEGVEGTRLLLRTPQGETLRLRVAPELSDGGALRLVLDRAPESGDAADLRLAVDQLRGVLTHRHRKLAGLPLARM
jgi:hypothetical protein